MFATPYLFFPGNCAEAMRFYERVLGGKLEHLMKYADAPEGQRPANADPDQIMHVYLTFDGGGLMASDDMSGAPYKGMSGFAIALNPKNAADAKRIFDELSEGGQIWMPLEKTFWSEAFGMCADRYGTPWMVSADLAQS